MNAMKWLRLAVFLTLCMTVAFGCAKKQVETAPMEQPAAAQQAPAAEQPAAAQSGSDLASSELTQKLNQAKAEITGGRIFFDFDKFDLKPEARDVLKAKAALLKQFGDIRVLIEGHCDERGTQEYNLALGERRARASYEFLVLLGVPASQLEMVSYGEEYPLDPGHDEAAWAKNRRDEFKIIK
ncbi:MAG: peptidoglycan-associated lipoprotein Pal [Desulfovibrionaceae bacterium]|jgi:peptidoglycan-associated lipoprotein|nr:peptidoglycan-associated lipoprotein Pal [Desulfovibrionaceae bacterium]